MKGFKMEHDGEEIAFEREARAMILSEFLFSLIA